MKITQHSAWRISLAHKIAPAFTANAKVEACFVFGSAALGIADQYSDLELALIWTQLPSALVLAQSNPQGLVQFRYPFQGDNEYVLLGNKQSADGSESKIMEARFRRMQA